MRFTRFVWSRLAFIATYVGFVTIAVIIVQLDLRISGASVQPSSILYMAFLGLVGLAIFLAADYHRWAGYLRRLANLHAESIDQLGAPPPAHCYEQQVFTQAWSEIYGRLRSEAINEQHKSQRNIRLVSQWAHHMKTPIAVIDLELQRAGKQSWPQEIIDTLTSIDEENQRLRHSLQSLLNMVRLEDFNADFRVELVDLGVLVRKMVNDYRRTFIAHRVFPKVDMAPTPRLLVHTDAKWLRFVLEQLLNNAIKYSSGLQREGQVVFRCFRAEAVTVLEIADNGIGMAPEDLSRVFQPFFTGVNGRSYPQSTGMGLYLARETCLRLGHQIRIAAEPDAGTRVQVIFPDSLTTHTGLLTP